MKTLNEVLNLAKQGKTDELDVLVAEAQGWRKGTDEISVWWYKDENTALKDMIIHYHPTANTERGRSQAWQLMVKYGINVIPNSRGMWKVRVGRNHWFHKNPQVAVVIAAILAAQGEE